MTRAHLPRPGRWTPAAVIGLVVLALVNRPGSGVDPIVGSWLWTALVLAAGLRIALRARGEQRLVWALLAAGVLTWGTGSLVYSALLAGHDSVAYPSVADVLWVGAYLPLIAGGLLLIRRHVVGRDAEIGLDGLCAAFAAAAVGAAVVLPLVDLGATGTLTFFVSAAYPVFDMVLLAIAVAGLTLADRRAAATWRWLGAGFIALAVADVVFTIEVAENADGLSALGGLGDLVWPVAFWLVAGAAPAEGRPGAVRPHLRQLPVVSLLAAGVAIAVLLADQVTAMPRAALLLAIAALVVSVARTALTLRTNLRLQTSATEAVTDELTGLGNRRSLLRDLRETVAARADATLALFDLDGFKAYNDAYGHAAGDGLLTSLGQRLRRATGTQATAYRLGGDEFCVLIRSGDVEHELVLGRAIEALRQSGEGFDIGASHGTVTLPADATDADAALQLADARMYARKDAGRASTRRQSRDLLLQLLHEQQPDLEEHSGDVGELVVAVGRRLGLDAEALDHARHGAELHDVGKVAIPAAILNKPGPLDDDEWVLMKRHTVIGERILCAVPALVPVGRIVRATHERWDGGGYPDGLRGEEIPLAARVIAVCDTFHAITTDRPYREGRSTEQALAELRRCAGTQFDAAVVEAFAAEVAAGTLERIAELEPAAEAEGDVVRRVTPATAIAQHAAGEVAQLAKLRGLLHATQLARSGADVEEVLDSVGRTVASSLGFRVVAINVFRPAWDDFVCTAVHGDDQVRELLLGKTEAADSWRPLVEERFARGGAYFVPAGEVDFSAHEDAKYHVPDIAPTDDPGAWQADDMLIVPLLGRNGDLLGMVSVDEPVWGRRPSDAEIEVLVAVAGHAALAIESARGTSVSRVAREAEQRMADLPAMLAATTDLDAVIDAVETCAREALRFGSVRLELVDVPDPVEALLEAGTERGGCVVLDAEAAAPARAWRGAGRSVRNGRGGRAWRDHLIAAPVRGEAGELLAVLWADDPEDRLLPHSSTLRVLRSIAGHAVVPLAWGRHAPAATRQAA
jgi:two-component system cell cycle response regulator